MQPVFKKHILVNLSTEQSYSSDCPQDAEAVSRKKIPLWTNGIKIANSLDQCLVEKLWTILGDNNKLENVKFVKLRLSKIQSLKRFFITTC